MTSRIERLVLRWLRAAAPRGWSDAVIGDLREDLDARGRGSRTRTLALTAVVAARFTMEAAAARLRRPPRTLRTGQRNMDIFTDLRQAARALARTPGFSLVAILTLALAIGANTAIYSALSSLVLNPLPFKDGDRFVYLWHKGPEMAGLMVTPSQVAVDQWRQASHVFEQIESHATRSFLLTGTGEPEEVNVSFLRSSALAMFGMPPPIGRPFVEADHAGDATPVVLLSDRAWKTRFGGDPEVAGKTLTLGETTYTIVGVMPRQFRLPMGSDEVWAAWRPGAVADENSGNTVAKLAPGVSSEQAQAALDTMPDVEGYKGWRGIIMRPADTNGPTIRTALFVLSGAVGLLLLIACVNVANLLLSRHSGRAREIAVRHALGASRGRLLRYLVSESAILAAAGGVAGLAVAYAGLAAMAALAPRDLDVLEQLRLDPNALLFAAAVTAMTGLLFGAGPAVWASRRDPQNVLRIGGRTATGAGGHIRAVLTVAQVAIALMLLVGASLLVRSYAKLTAIDPGYEPSGVMSVQVSLPASRYPASEPARRQALFDAVLASVEALPGVQEAAVGSGVPPSMGVSVGNKIEIEGRASDERAPGIYSGGSVTPAFFSTLGIPILEGRAFTNDDRLGRDPVAIVNQTFVRRHLPDRRAVGRKLRIGPEAPWMTIVGVAGDVKALGLTTSTGDIQIYRPRAQTRYGFGAIIVKADSDPRPLAQAIKQRIWAQDPLLPIGEITTADQLLSRSVAQWRFNLALLAVLAGCGLALAVVGVYGVTALFVGQLQREVGIRMALGATRAAVAALVVRQTLTMLAVALALGLCGAWWLSSYLKTLVFQTATTDVISFAAAAVGIAAAAFAATLVPLRRATSVDPAIVLRAE